MKCAFVLGSALLPLFWAGCSPQGPGADRAAAGSVAADPVAASAGGTSGTAPPEPGAIAVRLAAGSGFASLRIDEAWLARHGRPVLAQVRMVCRYQSARDQWQRLPATPTRIAYRMEPLPAAEARSSERVLFELPREPGLYWVHWIEQHEDAQSAGAVATRRALVAAGPLLCNEARPEPVPPGKVAACVPLQDRAEARLVPDPASACAELL